jgi:hypothetical protein
MFFQSRNFFLWRSQKFDWPPNCHWKEKDCQEEGPETKRCSEIILQWLQKQCF